MEESHWTVSVMRTVLTRMTAAVTLLNTVLLTMTMELLLMRSPQSNPLKNYLLKAEHKLLNPPQKLLTSPLAQLHLLSPLNLLELLEPQLQQPQLHRDQED